MNTQNSIPRKKTHTKEEEVSLFGDALLEQDLDSSPSQSTMNSNLNSMLSWTNLPQTDVRNGDGYKKPLTEVISTKEVTFLLGVQVSSVRICIFIYIYISSCNK